MFPSNDIRKNEEHHTKEANPTKGHEHQRKKVETNTDLRLEIKELETLGCLIRINL
jgi:hypothetical protein